VWLDNGILRFLEVDVFAHLVFCQPKPLSAVKDPSWPSSALSTRTLDTMSMSPQRPQHIPSMRAHFESPGTM
jgi:hypothetical protein